MALFSPNSYGQINTSPCSRQLSALDNQNIHLTPLNKNSTRLAIVNKSKLSVLDTGLMKIQTSVDIAQGAITSINYSPDNAAIYLLSTQGKLIQYSLPDLKLLTDINIAQDADNFLLSKNGRFILISNIAQHRLTIVDARNLRVIKHIVVSDKNGNSLTIHKSYHAPKRYSFMISFADSPQLWEIPYSDEAGVEIFKGWAHDYRKDGGEGKIEQWQIKDKFALRKLNLDLPANAIAFDHDYIDFITAYKNQTYYDVFNLDTKKRIASLRPQQALDIKKNVSWESNGLSYLAIATFEGDKLVIINTDSWSIIQKIKLEGKISAISSANTSSDILLGVQLASGAANLVIIDKTTMKIRFSHPLFKDNVINNIFVSTQGETAIIEASSGQKQLIKIKPANGQIIASWP